MKRRTAFKSMASVSLLPILGKFKQNVVKTPEHCHRLKTSLNAYSFNEYLTKGEMNIEEMILFCAEVGFDAVDITGYYFPNYPEVPTDDYIYKVKNLAFRHGLEISGIGVRNDFTFPNVLKRKESVQLVKNWVDVAQKLGAPVLRIFAGNQDISKFYAASVREWMIRDIMECVEYGAMKGIIIGMQNHNDFIKTEDDVHAIFAKINSPWFGLILDTGSFRTGDPYQQIENTIKYAVNWQIKEKIYEEGVETDTDIPRIIKIIKNACYKGYLPIETLGTGDHRMKIKNLLATVVEALNN